MGRAINGENVLLEKYYLVSYSSKLLINNTFFFDIRVISKAVEYFRFLTQVSKALLAEFMIAQKRSKPFKALGSEHMNKPSPVIPSKSKSTRSQEMSRSRSQEFDQSSYYSLPLDMGLHPLFFCPVNTVHTVHCSLYCSRKNNVHRWYLNALFHVLFIKILFICATRQAAVPHFPSRRVSFSPVLLTSPTLCLQPSFSMSSSLSCLGMKIVIPMTIFLAVVRKE
ncbi:putative acyl-CoA oxidase [Rosa chinensis]|uniref:Putative acyl-CoA oxidase n=1 Tax=Rosa chinensis TaxID=74649 RepID=A0A2P6S0H1_ROSCH|nr:putative acyl-CoA oxidase [Rosa chinensis]